MAGMRDLKRRIRSNKSIQKITRAMKMVSAAKLRKAQSAVASARPYSLKLESIMGRLVQGLGSFTHPLLEERTEGTTAYVVIAADRGLCAGYNQNVLRLAREKIMADGENASIIIVGRKAREFFLRRGYKIDEEYVDFGDLPDFIQARELARELMGMFTRGNYKKMILVYTEFRSVISYKPKVVPLLPIAPQTAEQSAEEVKAQRAEEIEYIYEPGPEEMLGTLLPRYVETLIYRAVLEAKASEHGARMTAMASATDNAGELIEKLTLSYNRARQAAITTEISEIVGGAAALK
ncbi:MAG: ATP synthase F1 subunit gamma [Bacillota bacterium]